MEEPKIRFKKNDGNDYPKLKKTIFGDTVTIERGGSPRPIDHYITEGEGLNWVKIGDAPKYGNYITKTAQRIISEGLQKTRQVFVGDLILSNSMSFGKPYIMGIDGCIHDGWLLIRNDQSRYNPKYLCFLLGSESMLKQYKSLAGGSTVNNLNKDLVAGTTVFIPCLEEQQKIADFLSSVDEVIAASEEEVANLETQKKAVMKKIFSQEVRFKLDDGSDFPEWEEDSFGNIFYKTTDYVAAGSFADLAKNVVYRNTRDYAQLVRTVDLKNCFSNKGFVYVDKHAYEFLWRVKLDDDSMIVLPNIGANIGEVYFIEPRIFPQERNVLGPNAILVGTVQNIVFWFNYLQSEDFQKRLRLIIASSGQPKFNKTELKSIIMHVPCLEEQRLIADFLSNFDEAIMSAKKELELWKELKKGLLQQMFV